MTASTLGKRWVTARRATAIYLLALAVWLVLGIAIETRADSEPARDGEAPLQNVLEAGLKARRPVEFAFIARVCDFVNRGELPRKLVQQTFTWSRRKGARPYPYFERAMQLHAKRLGVPL